MPTTVTPHPRLVQQTPFVAPSPSETLFVLLKEKVKAITDFFKVIIYGVAWREVIAAILPERVTKIVSFPVTLAARLSKLGATLKIAKNSLELAEVPEGCAEIAHAASSGEPKNFFHEVASKVHTFHEIAEVFVSQGIIDICKTSMSYFGGINHAALLYTQGLEAQKEYAKYHLPNSTPETKELAWLKGSKAMSYVTLATIGLVGFVLGTAFKTCLLACATSAVFYSIKARFYEKSVEPSKLLAAGSVSCC